MADGLNVLTDEQVSRLAPMLKWWEANGGHDPQLDRHRFDGTAGMSWQGYLSSDVTISSTNYTTVPFSQLTNNTTDVYSTTDAAAGFDLKIKKDGLFRITHTQQLIVPNVIQLQVEADIVLEDDSTAHVPKAGINHSWLPTSAPGHKTVTRSTLVSVTEDTSYRFRARRGFSPSDTYVINGGSSTEAQGSNWTVTYEGALP